MGRRISAPVAQTDVVSEFEGADFGDRRLEKRLIRIVERVAAKPDAPFPRALATEADLEGFYRFLRHPETKLEAVLGPHVAATVGRMAEHSEVLAVHDTSEFRFGGTREGLGRLKEAGHGFFGHCTLAVTADDSHAPLGVLHVEAWARNEPTVTELLRSGKISYAESKAMPTEQDRWFRSVVAAQSLVGEGSLIHVMDSEADDYKLLADLIGTELRWVIRLGYDRKVVSSVEGAKTKDVIAEREVLAVRKVPLSRRRRQPGGEKRKRYRVREQRRATLAIRAGTVELKRPQYLSEYPTTLTVNLVSVTEVNPPKDQEPIDWVLLTTEPIETTEHVLKVIDIYRGRWRIEEFFKALKTGCKFEKRQLESSQTLLTALAIFLPIAWNLLRLRTTARLYPGAPAIAALTELQTEVLRRASTVPLPRKLTVRDALMAVARLGGYHRSNGDPGWEVLGRGHQDLLMLVAGYRLATNL